MKAGRINILKKAIVSVSRYYFRSIVCSSPAQCKDVSSSYFMCCLVILDGLSLAYSPFIDRLKNAISDREKQINSHK